MKILQTIQEFKNKEFDSYIGIYWVEFKDIKYLVSRNNDEVKVIVNYSGGSDLVKSTIRFKKLFLDELAK